MAADPLGFLEPRQNRSGKREGFTDVGVPAPERSGVGAAKAANPAHDEQSFSDWPDGLGTRVVSPAAVTGSVLGQVGAATDQPLASPLSVVKEAKNPIELPRQFGRYRILERLGKGAMGAIYLALDTQLGRRVALKVPHLRGADDDAQPDQCSLDRFQREARVAATLNHRNICQVFDVGEIDGIPYLTMAYITGRNLSRYIRRDQPMSQRRAAAMVRQLAQALEEAHRYGVIHRDLKPSNIMVNARGELVIVDFGLVWRVGSQQERLTRVGLVVGTPMYMSPEQASGQVEAIGPSCDIYSLGVILYELLTGRVPFEGPEAIVVGQILFVDAPPPSKFRPNLNPLLEAICLKAIAKRVDQRYLTMGEFARALGEYLRLKKDRRSKTLDPPAAAAEVPSTAVEELTAEPAPSSIEAAAGELVDLEHPIDVTGSTILWRTWRQWTAIVEHFVLGRPASRINVAEYNNLYRSLLAECRARATAAQGPRREFYQRLEALVLPWMTPKTLKTTDQEILYSVLAHCVAIEPELLEPTDPPPDPQPAPRSRSGWWLAIGLLVASFALALGLTYLRW